MSVLEPVRQLESPSDSNLCAAMSKRSVARLEITMHDVHMTDKLHVPPAHKRAAQRMLLVLGTSIALVGAMSLAYAALPTPSYKHPAHVVVFALLALTLYFGVTVWLFIRVKSRDQIAHVGILLLTFLTTFFVLGFAWLYQQLEITDPGSFSEPLSKMSAVYFTVAVLSTVGFGDIRPIDDLARGVVTAQMVLSVGLLATAIGLVTQATRHVTRTPQSSDDTDSAPGESVPGEPGEESQTAD